MHQIILLYSLYNAISQLYFNKTGEEKIPNLHFDNKALVSPGHA